MPPKKTPDEEFQSQAQVLFHQQQQIDKLKGELERMR